MSEIWHVDPEAGELHKADDLQACEECGLIFSGACPCQTVERIAYDNFELVSPLGGLFRYYTSDGMYFREALNEQAHLTQPEDHKRISKTVYDLAYRTAQRQEVVNRER